MNRTGNGDGKEGNGNMNYSEAEFSLRPMEERDLAAAAEPERLSFSAPWSEAILQESLESRLDFLWVLEPADNGSGGDCGQEKEGGHCGRGLAGYCNLRVIAGEGELMRIAVHPELRGRGLSRKLMDRLEETAREKGAEALTLEVRKSNRTAIELYKSYGFREEAVRKNYYENPAEDALIMWLYFS